MSQPTSSKEVSRAEISTNVRVVGEEVYLATKEDAFNGRRLAFVVVSDVRPAWKNGLLTLAGEGLAAAMSSSREVITWSSPALDEATEVQSWSVTYHFIFYSPSSSTPELIMELVFSDSRHDVLGFGPWKNGGRYLSTFNGRFDEDPHSGTSLGLVEDVGRRLAIGDRIKYRVVGSTHVIEFDLTGYQSAFADAEKWVTHQGEGE